VVINAAYRIDSAFSANDLRPLPEHVLRNCVLGAQHLFKMRLRCKWGRRTSGSSSYIPTAAGDSSGRISNLTFEVDGVDYYYDRQPAVHRPMGKAGFTFLTGCDQTSFTLKLFNNAPGGGGNDWALDDISVATCSPDLTFTPTNNPSICANNTVDIGCIVQSYFNNYTHYKWQRSTNGGLSWSETGVSGTGSPGWNGSEWQYNVQYPRL
jgi:hypothetical protein